MKTLELLHAKIHGLRMIPNYKPSQFEIDINKIIAEEFKDECSECNDKLKSLKLQAELKQVQPQQAQGNNQGFFKGLFG